MPRLILASASPSRKRLLEGAGLVPEIFVSNVDEETDHFNAMSPKDLVIALAITKAHTVREQITGDAIIIGCDSTFEFEGKSLGKPLTKEVATARARSLSGKSGILYTGHCIIDTARDRELTDVAATKVFFSQMSDTEISGYVATGEPLNVAGGFTLDGLSAPFISKIEGEASNVIGLSLPLLRAAVNKLGYNWFDFVKSES